MRAHRKKEEEGRKGFDALEASFLEKGLIAAGSSRTMASKAIGEGHSSQEKHHAEREKMHRAKFVERDDRQVNSKRAEFITAIGKKAKPKRNQPTQQSKRQDVDDPNREKKR